MADSVESTLMPASAGRLNSLRIAISAAFACGILLSFKLWFGFGRTFPKAPLFDATPVFLSTIDFIFSFLLLVALVLAIVSKRPQRFLAAIVGLTVLLVILDQTRLQPWVYQYVLMLASVAFASNIPYGANSASIISANQLVVAFLYFWSGAQKLNWSFQHEVLPALLGVLGIHLPLASLLYVGIAVAVLESLIGLGLLVVRTRQAAAKLAIGMHLLLLLILIAGGHNSVVWPWNLAMIIILALLFHHNDNASYLPIKGSPIGRIGTAVFIICGILPVLNIFGWWDRYLSAALYSGTAPIAVAHISQSVRDQLPTVATQRIFLASNGDLMLPFYDWSVADLNVPTYPEIRVYRKIARQICGYTNDPNEVELVVRGRPSPIDGSYAVSRSNCSDLFLH